MTLGELLKQAREAKGLSTRELAEKVGVSHSTIYKYESDSHEPRISHLKWLAQALDLTLLELIERI
jgi:transcriptional regulator with XRE-family HTH domain